MQLSSRARCLAFISTSMKQPRRKAESYRNRHKVIELVRNQFGDGNAEAFTNAIIAGDETVVMYTLRKVLDPFNWTGGTLAQREAAKGMLKEWEGFYLG
jgi:hypothetical protein